MSLILTPHALAASEAPLFVGGSGNRILSSQDGTTWTQRAAMSIAGLAYSPSLQLYCGVFHQGVDRLRTSPDGITWTARNCPNTNLWTSMAWSPTLNLFLATGDNDGNMAEPTWMTSSDGINFTSRTHANYTGSTKRELIWAGDRFVVAARSNIIYQSTDGLAWTQSTIPTQANNSYEMVSYSGSRLIAIKQFPVNGHAYSDNLGGSWTIVAANAGLEAGFNVLKGLYAGGRFIHAGGGSPTGKNVIYSTDNGLSWTAVLAEQGRPIAYSAALARVVTLPNGASTVNGYSNDHGTSWLNGTIISDGYACLVK